MDVDWKFIALRIVNKDRDYETDFRPGLRARPHAGPRAAAGGGRRSRASSVGRRCCRCTRRSARSIHHERDRERFDDPSGVASVLEGARLPARARRGRAVAPSTTTLIAAETQEALDRCGGNIGTPVLSFTPPDGPSFFGPVINKAPKGKDAVDLWDAVVAPRQQPALQRAQALAPRPAAGTRRLTAKCTPSTTSTRSVTPVVTGDPRGDATPARHTFTPHNGTGCTMAGFHDKNDLLQTARVEPLRSHSALGSSSSWAEAPPRPPGPLHRHLGR